MFGHSLFFGNRLNNIDMFHTRAFQCPPDDGKGDGKDGGGDTKDTKGGGGSGGADLKAITDRLEKLEKENAELKSSKGKDDKTDDPDLQEKARLAREKKEKEGADSKSIEKALQFTMSSKEWLKQNQSALPKDVAGVFEAAEKENYGSAVEKANAIMDGTLGVFFKQQENLDLLTLAQKTLLEDYLKLTKTGRQEKAREMYENVFEPTFTMKLRIKKAGELAKAGHTDGGSDAEQAHRNRMMKLSRKHYLGEKENA